MKKHLSVLGLCLSLSLYKVLALAAAMAAAEALLFWLALPKGTDAAAAGAFDNVISSSHIAVVFVISLLLCLWICFGRVKNGSSLSNYSYTLQRLKISERSAFLWHCVSNTAVIAIFYMAQIAALALLARWFMLSTGGAGGPQGIYLSLCRSTFLHKLVPMQQSALWLYNASCILLMACVVAYAQLTQKSRFGGLAVFAVLVLSYQFMRADVSNSNDSLIYFMAAADLAITIVITAYGCIKAHSGRPQALKEAKGNA